MPQNRFLLSKNKVVMNLSNFVIKSIMKIEDMKASELKYTALLNSFDHTSKVTE